MQVSVLVVVRSRQDVRELSSRADDKLHVDIPNSLSVIISFLTFIAISLLVVRIIILVGSVGVGVTKIM
jgi:hypothetical protein